MVIFDEADEIFKQQANVEAIQQLIEQYFVAHKIKPQYLLFSATFEEDAMLSIRQFIDDFLGFRVKNEALNLKGVK